MFHGEFIVGKRLRIRRDLCVADSGIFGNNSVTVQMAELKGKIVKIRRVYEDINQVTLNECNDSFYFTREMFEEHLLCEGDKVKVPRTKRGMTIVLNEMTVGTNTIYSAPVRRAVERNQNYMYVTQFLTEETTRYGKPCFCVSDTQNGGDYFFEEELKLYDETAIVDTIDLSAPVTGSTTIGQSTVLPTRPTMTWKSVQGELTHGSRLKDSNGFTHTFRGVLNRFTNSSVRISNVRFAHTTYWGVDSDGWFVEWTQNQLTTRNGSMLKTFYRCLKPSDWEIEKQYREREAQIEQTRPAPAPDAEIINYSDISDGRMLRIKSNLVLGELYDNSNTVTHEIYNLLGKTVHVTSDEDEDCIYVHELESAVSYKLFDKVILTPEFNVGDKVRIIGDLSEEDEYGIGVNRSMLRYADRVMTISEVKTVGKVVQYIMEEDEEWSWLPPMFKKLTEEELANEPHIVETTPIVFSVFNELAYTSVWNVLERGFI